MLLSDRLRNSAARVSCRIKHKSIPGQLHACNRQTSGSAEISQSLPAPPRPRACIFRVNGSNGVWSHETSGHSRSVSAPTCNDLAFNFNFFLTKERKLGPVHCTSTSILPQFITTATTPLKGKLTALVVRPPRAL